MFLLRGLRRKYPLACLLASLVTLFIIISKFYYNNEQSLRLTASGLLFDSGSSDTPIAWVRGRNQQTGYLRHVHEVLHFLGYRVANYTDEEGSRLPWDLLWSHTYPFKELKSLITNLSPHQKVNHFPGSGFISSKVSLAESNLKCIPKAFRIPKDREKLTQYAKDNPKKMFVSKSNNHRGIQVKPLKELDLSSEGSFVQEFVHNPLLIDGHKFDVGVYVILTSVEPLRVYWYAGDVLFRFCPAKYHPFDASVKDKYVVGDDYLPTWKVPSLVPYYSMQGFSMKDSFDAWLRDQEKDPSIIWDSISSSIAEVFYTKEGSIIKAVKSYKNKNNFFEMMRFDFIIDEDLLVYLMEANMSPNLSSAHFKQNKLLYRQVILNTLRVSTLPVNELKLFKKVTEKVGEELSEEQQFISAVKEIVVFPEFCASGCSKPRECDSVSCELCYKCSSVKLIRELVRAHGEHIRRGLCQRIVPPPILSPHSPLNTTELNPDNTLISEWFRGKCLLDKSFC